MELSRSEIVDAIQAINSPNPLRDKALIAFLYLSGCRVEECVKYMGLRTVEVDVEVPGTIKGRRAYMLQKQEQLKKVLIGYPIVKKQVEFFKQDELIIHNVRILKRRKWPVLLRNIPIVINNKEKDIYQYFMNYLSYLDREEPIFNMTRERAWQIIKEVGLTPHILRHIRLTHLAQDYDFTDQQLVKFTGWHDSRQASNYVRMNVGDLLKKMKK